jgi:hypothetical protein
MSYERCNAATQYGMGPPCHNDYKTCRWHKGWREMHAMYEALKEENLLQLGPSTAPLRTAVPARPEPNTVNHPAHYNVGKIEAITVIEDWNLGFNLGNCVKYVARADHKGNAVEDLKKALWYLQRELDRRKA